MRKSLLPILMLASIAAVFFPWNARAVSFADFEGDYDTRASMSVADGSGAEGEGTAKIHFRLGTAKNNGRLNITGNLVFDDETTRAFSVSFVFKQNRGLFISNLAPGIDDGLDARGDYKFSRRRISATVPFETGNVTGTATIEVRLRNRPRGPTLDVVQTLSTSAITRTIIWKFSGTLNR